MIRVLVVEDDRLVRRALFRQLTHAGYLVSVAASVRNASHCTNPPPDAVVCDYDLPDGTAIDVYGALNEPKHFIVHTGNSGAYVPTDIPRFTKPDFAGVLEQLSHWFGTAETKVKL
jgi:DNA-binding NtrC family response regulator